MSVRNLNAIRCGKCGHLTDCIFSELSEEELSQVAQFLRPVRCEISRTLQYADIPAMPGYYIICRGKGAVITTIPEGKRLVTQFLRGGNGVMVSPHWSEGRYTTFIRVFGETLITFITGEDLLELHKRYPSIGLRVFEKSERQARFLRERLIETAYAGSKARVALLILELEEISLLEMKFSQEELAEMVGISREMLNRQLREFSDRSLISLKHHRISINDIDGLTKIARGIPEL
ncbi:TPA: Crp/Fnr family transcriptional regulator [Candidatus Bipolaricaulota bacterium]|nr:Crp/Fnr family transcriptional regulator [Candidatus Bipolaricaulota bacterium]